MQLDFLTLLATTAISLFMISASLPLIMGRNISAAARYVQASLLLQALAWAAIIASTYVPATLADRIISTISIGCGSAAQWMNYRALAGWLGPRPWPRLLLVLVAATPLGYFLGFDSYAFRVGWANVLLAAVTLLVARATLQPQRPAEAGWRRLILFSMLTMAGLTLARGIVGAFTDQYPSFRTPHPVNLAFALGACVTVILNTIAMLVAWRDEAEFKLRELAVTDPLTGLPNRRGFEERAQAMLAHARRHELPLTALMLDLDHFKQVNDLHGHEVGDHALELFARLLKDTRRNGDLAARLGGEEFCLLLHDDTSAGLPLDQRLRQRLRLAAPAELGLALDFSAGMAALRPDDTGILSLLARADAALYEAKTAGRGRLCNAAPIRS
ncbi:GGDEF domain-containing protein [Simplicispira lacusdiani]|uniref:GGDEF domain-containing protein n=1 Tax=Simplicispira lacusdiani TaxID=2213010 RepID=UPI000E753106|nr:GGDEF domain-containing protein [Simplicispira lacusdiani]